MGKKTVISQRTRTTINATTKLVIKYENTYLPDPVANSVNEFKYEPEERIIFKAYYRRFEQIFEKECQDWIEEMKAR